MAGGVAANGVLRERMREWGAKRSLTVRLPEKRYCTDNAAMIAFAGLQRQSLAGDPRRVTARSRIA
jgi:N6-L-threonylcarbamoyladenine synthase